MKSKFEYVIYAGNCFTLEWYFDALHKSQALDYYSEFTVDERIKFLKLVKRIGDAGEIKDTTKFKSEGDKIYAFKPQPDRFLFFFYDGQKIIVTNAFKKKQQKLPKAEKDKALKRREQDIGRTKRGEYYE